MNVKTCPHCGGTACLTSNYSYKTRTYFVMCKCDICGAQGKIFASDEEPTTANWENAPCQDAINAWNMRYGGSDEN